MPIVLICGQLINQWWNCLPWCTLSNYTCGCGGDMLAHAGRLGTSDTLPEIRLVFILKAPSLPPQWEMMKYSIKSQLRGITVSQPKPEVVIRVLIHTHPRSHFTSILTLQWKICSLRKKEHILWNTSAITSLGAKKPNCPCYVLEWTLLESWCQEHWGHGIQEVSGSNLRVWTVTISLPRIRMILKMK